MLRFVRSAVGPGEGSSDRGTHMHAAIRRLGTAFAVTLLAATGTMAAALASAPASNPASGVARTVASATLSTPAASAERPRGSITGRVVSDVDRKPLADVCVTVFAADQRDPGYTVGESCTDAHGRYRIAVRPGRYVAQFYDPTARFASEFNGNRLAIEKAPVIVVKRQTAAVVPAALAPGGQLDGRAVDAVTGAPLANVCPDARLGRTSTTYLRTVDRCSNASGHWSVKGLPAGGLTVGLFLPGARSATWAYDAVTRQDASLFSLARGGHRWIGNVRVAALGTITGLVTSEDGALVTNAWVNLEGRFPGRAGPGEGPLSAHTDEQGRYTVATASPGSYRPIVYADDYSAFAPEWSGDSDTLGGASPITVASGASSTLDFQVAQGARLNVDIVEDDGSSPTRNLDGFITLASGEYIGDFSLYNGQVFSTNALPGGPVILRLDDSETGESYWYDGATSLDAATLVTLTRGQTKRVTFHLPD